MKTLILTLNGDYSSYVRWVEDHDTGELFRDNRVIIICWFNTDQKEPMDNYKSEIMCSINDSLDLEALKTSLDKSIRDNINKNNSQDFSLISVKTK